jgi:leukotriene-A4 hydrolase
MQPTLLQGTRDIASAAIGPRSSLATGPEELESAKWELEADTERFIQAAEVLSMPVG